MTRQLDMFTRPRPPQPRNAIARQRDPQTSHEAAEQVTSSGTRDRQAGEVLTAVHAHPGMTSRELAREAGLDRYVTARRLPELERLGRVRRGPARVCAVSEAEASICRRAVTWWPED